MRYLIAVVFALAMLAPMESRAQCPCQAKVSKQPTQVVVPHWQTQPRDARGRWVKADPEAPVVFDLRPEKSICISGCHPVSAAVVTRGAQVLQGVRNVVTLRGPIARRIRACRCQ